jgi:hypothetical protein
VPQCLIGRFFPFTMGTSMYYVSTKGEGGGQPNAYVCLRGGGGARGHTYVSNHSLEKMLNNLLNLPNLNKNSTQSRNWKEFLFFSGRYKDCF